MGDGGGHCGGCIKGHVYGYAITWTRVGLSGFYIGDGLRGRNCGGGDV